MKPNFYITTMLIIGIIIMVLSCIILFAELELNASNSTIIGLIGLLCAMNIMDGIKLKKIQIMMEENKNGT